jgi:hypothetical protein
MRGSDLLILATVAGMILSGVGNLSRYVGVSIAGWIITAVSAFLLIVRQEK